MRSADERHCLGPATTTGPDGRRSSAYLDYAALERALTETRADAAWVGWGFVAEHPAFAELCERLGIVFVGPDAARDARAGRQDRGQAPGRAGRRARRGLERRPGRDGRRRPSATAAELGFPLDDQGGRRRRRARHAARGRAEELPVAFERARAEAEGAFGDPSVLMERLVGAARHVEVQLMADGQGGVWALGVRDCSYQRRHQKVVEESASPALTAGPGGRAERLPPRASPS